MAIKRKFSPVRSDDKLSYHVNGDVITVTHTTHVEPIKGEGNELGTQIPMEVTDVFDFTGLPDGEANVQEFETTLPINPFVSVKRANGQLEVVVINFIGANATEDEKFPTEELVEDTVIEEPAVEEEVVEEPTEEETTQEEVVE